jgi:hypothetical protein
MYFSQENQVGPKKIKKNYVGPILMCAHLKFSRLFFSMFEFDFFSILSSVTNNKQFCGRLSIVYRSLVIRFVSPYSVIIILIIDTDILINYDNLG